MRALSELVNQAKKAIENAENSSILEQIRIEYLGKKGFLTLQMMQLKEFSAEERPKAGQLVNQAKTEIQHLLNEKKIFFENESLNLRLKEEEIDISLPGTRNKNGGLHPVTRTIRRIESFFHSIGFTTEFGPEIENSYHNFDALNISANHPARADHDTFWFDENVLLRTQTSSVQIRYMSKNKPPIRIIAPGKTYRNDYDQTHTPMFHQMEGLMVDRNITFANLKSIIYEFLTHFFESDLQIRFRSSHFPFTEPSAEVDILGKNGKWLEVLGCGIVHPNVLKNVGIDPNEYSGFAFGVGLERLTMLRYQVNDLRSFFESDLRFLKQFK